MLRVASLGGAVLILALAGCSAPATPEAAPPEEVRPVETPAAPGSAEPNLVSGADGRLYLSWIEPRGQGDHALRFATWEGAGWSQPRTIASGDDWFVNWADFPSMAALADGTLAAHWLVKSADNTYAYDVLLSVSADGGTTWSAPVRPHDDGTATEHGFVSLVPLDDAFLVAWLDGREMAAEPPGPMTLRQARLERDGSVGAARVMDPSVCDCCPTDAVWADDDVVLVYRDRTADEVRDIYSVRLLDGTDTPRAVHADGWVIAGCPVNGPAVDAVSGRTAVAWFTEAAGADDDAPGSVRVAFSEDGGNSFSPPIPVDDGRPLGRVDVTFLDDDSALVSWLEQLDDAAALRLRRVTPGGGAPTARTVTRTDVSRSSGFPKLVRHEDHVVLAWTATGRPSRVVTARLPLADLR